MVASKLLTTEILDTEWEMFAAVRNVGGPAACQQDPATFETMRASQLASWDDPTAKSYLDDLRRARADGRNLMSEKYARMMEQTSPSEFRQLAPRLPALEEGAAALIGRLSTLSVCWMEQLAARYPYLSGRGRPIRASVDDRRTVSFETYTRGELATYSLRTLELLEAHYLDLVAGGESPAEVILLDTVQRYGFASLEQAEAAAKAHAERKGGPPA